MLSGSSRPSAAARPVGAVYHGLPDAFCCWYGTLNDIRRKIGLDPEGIRKKLELML